MLIYRERRPAGEPEGMLILHHGRGTDEHDLLAIGELLDPERRLHIVTPRAPLQLAGSPGYHWYLVPRVGYPDRASFDSARAQLGSLHDELAELTAVPPARTLLGGFSMGAVMSYALGLDGERPVMAGLLAFSGFIPQAEGFAPDLTGRGDTRVFVAHGDRDAVIDVEFGRSAVATLRGGGIEVEYHESSVGHRIDPAHLPPARAWIGATLFGEGSAGP
ncbi:MAG TPA: phospholipase [Solirubrobacteraceae bacterium]|jgi:phospholipase/carboxylesterase